MKITQNWDYIVKFVATMQKLSKSIRDEEGEEWKWVSGEQKVAVVI